MWIFPLFLSCSAPSPSSGEGLVVQKPVELEDPFVLGWADGLTGQASVVFDVTDPTSGWIGVTARYEGLAYGPRAVFRRVSNGDEHRFREVRFTDDEGRDLPHLQEGVYWKVDDPPATLVMTYQVQPGGLGRHGHQGFLAEDWASFDGRVLLLPRGGHGIADLKVQYQVPDTWAVHTPFRQGEHGWWHVDTTGPGWAMETLQTSCVALGRFEAESVRLGGTELRVVAHDSFDPVWRGDVVQKTIRLAEWFHHELAWDLQQPFLLAWLPKPSESGVFGGAWSTGACYEHPVENGRNWELLGHRFAHPVNKYNPTGMTLADDRDHWFMEGWASYIEVVGASANGLGPPDEQAFNRMWRRYTKQRLHHLDFDGPLADEPRVQGEATEFLHYLKGPLVVKLLADTLEERSGKSMEAFHAAMYTRYGRHRSRLPLREELERFTGLDLSDFWSRYVDETGVIVPVWSGYGVHKPGAEAASRGPMARAGTLSVQDDLLFYLAWSGQFTTYAAIERFLEDAARRRVALEAGEVRLWPAWMYDVEEALEPGVRLSIWQAEEAYMGGRVTDRPRSPGCGAVEAPVQFELNPAHPAATIWEGLREKDAAYQRQRTQVGLEAFVLSSPMKRGQGPLAERLALLDDEPIAMVSRWTSPPPYVGYRVVEEGVSRESQRNPVEPTWTRTWLELSPEDRGNGERLLTLQLEYEDEVMVERAFWQRPRPD
jgi:hypothetical protein